MGRSPPEPPICNVSKSTAIPGQEEDRNMHPSKMSARLLAACAILIPLYQAQNPTNVYAYGFLQH
jgi:hypothetical protein